MKSKKKSSILEFFCLLLSIVTISLLTKASKITFSNEFKITREPASIEEKILDRLETAETKIKFETLSNFLVFIARGNREEPKETLFEIVKKLQQTTTSIRYRKQDFNRSRTLKVPFFLHSPLFSTTSNSFILFYETIGLLEFLSES
jgi:hypothetical protein